jgi:hypothetical protein
LTRTIFSRRRGAGDRPAPLFIGGRLLLLPCLSDALVKPLYSLRIVIVVLGCSHFFTRFQRLNCQFYCHFWRGSIGFLRASLHLRLRNSLSNPGGRLYVTTRLWRAHSRKTRPSTHELLVSGWSLSPEGPKGAPLPTSSSCWYSYQKARGCRHFRKCHHHCTLPGNPALTHPH